MIIDFKYTRKVCGLRRQKKKNKTIISILFIVQVWAVFYFEIFFILKNGQGLSDYLGHLSAKTETS